MGLLTSNRIIKCLFRKMTRLVGRVEDLVVENREVQCQTQTDWVGRSKIGSSNLGSSFVSLQRLVGRSLALIAKSKFSEITVIVTLPVGICKLVLQVVDVWNTDIL